ncbi:head-tail connector protein [Pseudaeromonas pectinilytica]
MLISPEEAKRQCRLELDDATEDDHLGLLIAAAITQIENDINKQLIPADQEPAVSSEVSITQQLTPTLRMAALMLISHWYTNREAVVTGTIATTLPLAYASLINPYRDLAVG